MNSDPSRLATGLKRLTELAMALAMAAMVAAVFVNVVLRYGFGTGIVFYEELSRLLLVWLVCVGSVLAAAEGQHLGMDLLTTRLAGWPARLCRWVSQLLVLFCLALVIKGSWEQVLAGMDSFSTVIGYPLALAAAAGLVMALGMVAVAAVELARGLPAPRAAAEPAVE